MPAQPKNNFLPPAPRHIGWGKWKNRIRTPVKFSRSCTATMYYENKTEWKNAKILNNDAIFSQSPSHSKMGISGEVTLAGLNQLGIVNLLRLKVKRSGKVSKYVWAWLVFGLNFDSLQFHQLVSNKIKVFPLISFLFCALRDERKRVQRDCR